jgi:hypothetical protein
MRHMPTAAGQRSVCSGCAASSLSRLPRVRTPSGVRRVGRGQWQPASEPASERPGADGPGWPQAVELEASPSRPGGPTRARPGGPGPMPVPRPVPPARRGPAGAASAGASGCSWANLATQPEGLCARLPVGATGSRITGPCVLMKVELCASHARTRASIHPDGVRPKLISAVPRPCVCTASMV